MITYFTILSGVHILFHAIICYFIFLSLVVPGWATQSPLPDIPFYETFFDVYIPGVDTFIIDLITSLPAQEKIYDISCGNRHLGVAERLPNGLVVATLEQGIIIELEILHDCPDCQSMHYLLRAVPAKSTILGSTE
jgi:hypothetical protein